MLYAAIALLSSREEVEMFLSDLLTKQELHAITTRFTIARMLYVGMKYRAIIQETGASSTTVARVSQWLRWGNGGLLRVIQDLLPLPRGMNPEINAPSSPLTHDR